jgi:hypothetical protein
MLTSKKLDRERGRMGGREGEEGGERVFLICNGREALVEHFKLKKIDIKKPQTIVYQYFEAFKKGCDRQNNYLNR